MIKVSYKDKLRLSKFTRDLRDYSIFSLPLGNFMYAHTSFFTDGLTLCKRFPDAFLRIGHLDHASSSVNMSVRDQGLSYLNLSLMFSAQSYPISHSLFPIFWNSFSWLKQNTKDRLFLHFPTLDLWEVAAFIEFCLLSSLAGALL